MTGERVQTVAVDFDGVIHAYSRGWHDGTCYDGPVPGAFDALRYLLDRYAVVIHTTRDPDQVAGWLVERLGIHQHCGIEIEHPDDKPAKQRPEFWNERNRLLVTNRKLPAVAYIDDRAIRFRTWQQALMELAVPDSLALARVDVRVADAEPVASFIAQVTRADSVMRQLTNDEAVALPDAAVRAWSMLQTALRALGVNG